MSKNNGGPAFPIPEHEHVPGIVIGQQEGMTLRDYFAAKALQGMCADSSTAGMKVDDLVMDCYRIADAMLAEREKNQ